MYCHTGALQELEHLFIIPWEGGERGCPQPAGAAWVCRGTEIPTQHPQSTTHLHHPSLNRCRDPNIFKDP